MYTLAELRRARIFIWDNTDSNSKYKIYSRHTPVSKFYQSSSNIISIQLTFVREFNKFPYSFETSIATELSLINFRALLYSHLFYFIS